MKKPIQAGIAVVLAAAGEIAMSHGGGLDKSGCRHDRKTGTTHCHRWSGRPAGFA